MLAAQAVIPAGNVAGQATDRLPLKTGVASLTISVVKFYVRWFTALRLYCSVSPGAALTDNAAGLSCKDELCLGFGSGRTGA